MEQERVREETPIEKEVEEEKDVPSEEDGVCETAKSRVGDAVHLEKGTLEAEKSGVKNDIPEQEKTITSMEKECLKAPIATTPVQSYHPES